jgi:hypothetical protein
MLKPGYKTTEFWFTLVSFIFSGAYLFGILDDFNQKEDLINETSKGVEAVVLIIGQLALFFRYLKGRTDIKKIWWDTASPEERKEVNKKSSSRSKNDTKRTNSTRSRKTSKSNKDIVK